MEVSFYFVHKNAIEAAVRELEVYIRAWVELQSRSKIVCLQNGCRSEIDELNTPKTMICQSHEHR